MADTLMYIPNDETQNYHFSRLKLVVKTFKLMKQPFTKIPEECVIIKLWGLV